MNSKNKYSVICITVVIILTLLLYSCTKKTPKLPKKRDRTTIEKYLELGYKTVILIVPTTILIKQNILQKYKKTLR